MVAATESDCLFCRIAAGEVPADIVVRGARTLAFRDVSPQAPTHLLSIPREHHPDVTELAAVDADLLAEVVRTGAEAAAVDGLSEHRVVFNTGPQAGQSVFHVHAHVLGGRRMGWPPG